ncbi:hypothetical protein H7U37_08630 [Pseudoflavonifractor phocaeensis]|uniref:CdaR family protein n=1 Tax=Pseudoflavonifractor phocaeensis TaxID=1870988 RepID=UPI00195D7805|nr:hypothetical protein [Pseudoflavonifractor phocaeensis]MBM6938586.1 hypothetical protein [Pseudoflavonifractor phocaeensis]
MEKIKESKWTYAILSVLVAIIMWMYVGSDLNVETTVELYNIPVVFEGKDDLADRMLMITEGADQTVNLKLRVNRSSLFKFNSDTVSVVVDVSKIEDPKEYTSTYRLVTPNTVSSSSVTDLTENKEITFTVARLVERNVEVQGRLDSDVVVADGYQIGEFSIVPGTVSVSGESSAVNQVDHAVVVVSSEAPLSETYTGELPVQLVGTDGQMLDQEALHLAVDMDTVQVTLPVVQTKEVKLTVDLKAGGGATADHAEVDIEPKSITVAGSASALEGLTEITLPKIIDLSQIYTQEEYTIPIQLDSELTNVSGVTQATVTVKLSGLTSRTIEVETGSIEQANLPEGYTATVVTQSFQVQIRGEDAEAVESVIASQLRVVADLSGVTAVGSQTVPVQIYLNGSSDVGVVGSYRVSVSVQRE